MTRITSRLEALERQSDAIRQAGLLVYEAPADLSNEDAAAWLRREVANPPAQIIELRRFGRKMTGPRLVRFDRSR